MSVSSGTWQPSKCDRRWTLPEARRWRYLLLSATNIETASGSWSARGSSAVLSVLALTTVLSCGDGDGPDEAFIERADQICEEAQSDVMELPVGAADVTLTRVTPILQGLHRELRTLDPGQDHRDSWQQSMAILAEIASTNARAADAFSRRLEPEADNLVRELEDLNSDFERRVTRIGVEECAEIRAATSGA